MISGRKKSNSVEAPGDMHGFSTTPNVGVRFDRGHPVPLTL